MAKKTKHNAKLPKDPVSNNEIDPEYGFIHGEWDSCGGHVFHYRNPEEHEKSFSQEFHPSGGYKTVNHDKDAKQLTTVLNPGENRRYVAGGDSHHTDSHYDLHGEATGLTQFGGDAGFVAKKDYYRGSGGKAIILTKESSLHGTSGASDADKRYTTNGSEIKTVTGNKYDTVRGKTCKTHEKEHLLINQGDYAQHDAKNSDHFVKQKYKVESGDTYAAVSGSSMALTSGDKTDMVAKKDITIKSDSKITIKVGGSSIVIEDSKITIKSSEIKFERG